LAQEFRLQDPGEGIHEAEIQEVLVSEGDAVEEGQMVFVIETDKAAVEIPVPFTGTVAEIPVKAGDMVRVGDLLMTVEGEGGSESADAREETAEEGSSEEKEAQPEEAEAEAEAGEEEAQPEPEKADDEGEAERHGPEREEEAADEKKRPEPAEAAGEAEEKPPRREGAPVPATPATRRVARELGVDLHDVRASGKHGRVTEQDVRAHAERGQRPAAAEAPAPVELPDFSKWGPVEREPLRSLRRSTAQHMATSWSQIPHVTHQDEVDITELERFRQRHAEAFDAHGAKLTLTAFALKASAAALGEFPRFNASFDGAAEEIVLKRYVHIGVALDSERGLMVPVIRDVDRKSVAELARELTEMSGRLRDGAPSPEELQGGTFTVTNVGGLGGTGFTPIVNHPQAAILGMAEARLKQVVTGTLDEPAFAVRLMLPICVAFDHRVNDGADAARFTRRIADLLADPERFALSV
jgi:pyruvate dehydrogenase E2 component (dihydrolipoamide acetyltransferase)